MNVKKEALLQWVKSFQNESDALNGFEAFLNHDQVEVFQHKKRHSTITWNEELYKYLSKKIPIQSFTYLHCKTKHSHIGNNSFKITFKTPDHPNEFHFEFIICSEKHISIWFFPMNNHFSTFFLEQILIPFFQALLDYFKHYFANFFPSQRVRFLLEQPFEYCYDAKTYFQR